MFVSIWEFLVRPGSEPDFERIYGPEGDWARLFRKGQGYVRTELTRDLDAAGRYVVLDYWNSREDYDQFRSQHRAEYGELDRRCQGLTEMETPMGSFVTC